MAERPVPRTTALVVRRADRIGPHLIRVVATPRDPAAVGRFVVPHTDGYVKVVFRRPGVVYPEPFDLATARSLPAEQWPAQRTYTLREVRPDRAEIVIDFVHHGDAGLAGPWAAGLLDGSGPGTEFLVLGPGGAYAPDPAADWHLLAGDDSALPAIAAALRAVPVGAPVHAFVEVDGPADEQPLPGPGVLTLTWLHRGAGGDLAAAVAAAELPTGRAHAFVHGEAGFVKELRRMLRVERQIPRQDLSISGYWRRGRTAETFREWKRELAGAEPT
jgi:NADPH-dependent ferric siderophore reductase